MNGGGFVAGGFEIGGDGGDFAGFGDEGSVGYGVDPIVGEAGEDFELDVGGAAAVVGGIHVAAGVFGLELAIVGEDFAAGVGVKILEIVLLEADGGVKEAFV